jgi:hypothetical protein
MSFAKFSADFSREFHFDLKEAEDFWRIRTQG